MKKYYDGDVTCDITEIHEDGTLYLAECSVNGVGVDYTYGEQQGSTPGEPEPICKAVTTATVGTVPQGQYVNGDEYKCNVDGTNKYTFFILSANIGNEVITDLTRDGITSYNLIMSHNIDKETGAPTTSGNAVTWYSREDQTFGPVTAMNSLHQATSSWTNIENINMNYTDEGNRYGGLNTIDNVTKITKNNGAQAASYTDLKARLPMKSELTAVGCSDAAGSCRTWVNGNLNSDSIPYGYWTLASESSNDYLARAWFVQHNGSFGSFYTNNDLRGIRPVIMVSKSKLN